MCFYDVFEKKTVRKLSTMDWIVYSMNKIFFSIHINRETDRVFDYIRKWTTWLRDIPWVLGIISEIREKTVVIIMVLNNHVC